MLASISLAVIPRVRLASFERVDRVELASSLRHAQILFPKSEALRSIRIELVEELGPPVKCDSNQLSRIEVSSGAFYCSGSNRVLLGVRLAERVGRLGSSLILSHELGHAIGPLIRPSLEAELIADCYAGILSQSKSSAYNTYTQFELSDFGPFSNGSHGNSVDRLMAFSMGSVYGRCDQSAVSRLIVPVEALRTRDVRTFCKNYDACRLTGDSLGRRYAAGEIGLPNSVSLSLDIASWVESGDYVLAKSFIEGLLSGEIHEFNRKSSYCQGGFVDWHFKSDCLYR